MNLKEINKVTKFNEDDIVLNLDIAMNIMDGINTKGNIKLITPIDSDITIKDFKLENQKIIGQIGSIIKTNENLNYEFSKEKFEPVICNNRYPNKRYDTLTASNNNDKRKKCQCGIPIIIPTYLKNEHLSLNIEMISHINTNTFVKVIINKKIIFNNYTNDNERFANMKIRFWKTADEFAKTIQLLNINDVKNYQLNISNDFKEIFKSYSHQSIDYQINPSNIQYYKDNEENMIIEIKFDDNQPIQLGYEF